MELKIIIILKKRTFKIFIIKSMRNVTIRLLRFIKKLIIHLFGILVAFSIPIFSTREFLKNKSRQQVNVQNLLYLVSEHNLNSKKKKFNLNGSSKVNEGILEDLFILEKKTSCFAMEKKISFLSFMFARNEEFRRAFLDSDSVLLSIPGSSGFLASYIKMFCFKKVIYVAHNAEFLHRIEWAKNSTKYNKKAKYFFRAVKGLFSDFFVANTVDFLLVLGEKEIEHYWNKIKMSRNSAKSFYLPYVPPKRLQINRVKRTTSEKRIIIVGTFSKSEGENRISENVEAVASIFRENGLEVYSIGNGIRYPGIKDYGFVSEVKYIEIINSCQAIWITSDWGWGFKTKIADAIFNHQRVFLPSRLANRYPSIASGLNIIDNGISFIYSKDSLKARLERKRIMQSMIDQRMEILNFIV